MNELKFENKEYQSERLNKINHNYNRYTYESPIRKREFSNVPIYLLITDYDEKMSQNIIKEFKRFGDIQDIQTEKNSSWMILNYFNSEEAKFALENYNPFISDPFNRQFRINVRIINEEEKKNFLRSIYEDRNLIDGGDYNIIGGNRGLNKMFPTTNREFYTFEEPKSNFRKFLDVFFNL